MKYLIPSQGRWALVVPHPQPGGRHVKYFFPHWASCGAHGGLRAKSPTHNFKLIIYNKAGQKAAQAAARTGGTPEAEMMTVIQSRGDVDPKERELVN